MTGRGAVKRMRCLTLSLVTCCLLLGITAAEAADDMEYNVTLTGACQYQIIMGWDDCQDKAVYTVFKGGKYTFDFIDREQERLPLCRKKRTPDRQ